MNKHNKQHNKTMKQLHKNTIKQHSKKHNKTIKKHTINNTIQQ